ncbi:UNVERIFIED_CONTAM: ABC transporter G family member 37, partial [Sesamum latifolium]
MLLGSLYYVVTASFLWAHDISMTIQKLPVFYKQRDFFFYPAWAYGLPSWIVKIPAQAVEVAVYVALTYYVIGYDPSVWKISLSTMHYLLLKFVEDSDGIGNISVSKVQQSDKIAFITANTYGFLFIAHSCVNEWLCSFKTVLNLPMQ